MTDESLTGRSPLLRAPVSIDRVAGCLHIDPILPAALYELADKMCKSIAHKPKRKRMRSWVFGIPGSPSGRFFIVPFTRATTNPSRWPAIEPTGHFHITVSLENDDLEEIRTSVVVAINERTGRITALPQNQTDDIHIVSALERTLVAIARANFVLVKRQDRPECMFCNRGLDDPISCNVGFGPDCARRYQLAHRESADDEHRAASDARRKRPTPMFPPEARSHPKVTIFDQRYRSTRVRLIDHGYRARHGDSLHVPYVAYRSHRGRKAYVKTGALLVIDGWSALELVPSDRAAPADDELATLVGNVAELIRGGTLRVIADYRSDAPPSAPSPSVSSEADNERIH